MTLVSSYCSSSLWESLVGRQLRKKNGKSAKGKCLFLLMFICCTVFLHSLKIPHSNVCRSPFFYSPCWVSLARPSCPAAAVYSVSRARRTSLRTMSTARSRRAKTAVALSLSHIGAAATAATARVPHALTHWHPTQAARETARWTAMAWSLWSGLGPAGYCLRWK